MIDFYLRSTNHLIQVMDGIKTKVVPNKFTHKFVKEITKKETTYDRDYKKLMEKLEFIDYNSIPTNYFYQYKNANSNEVLMERIKVAYSELFDISNNANQLDIHKIKERLRIVNGIEKINDKDTTKIAETFYALCRYAENSSPSEKKDIIDKNKSDSKIINTNKNFNIDDIKELAKENNVNLVINLQLPDTADEKVYEKIFKACKKIYTE